jgi:tetratricopeptide (TPR) repeat protein
MKSFSYYIEKSFSYNQYINLINDLLAQGKTTGPEQTPFLIEYTNMNLVRMNRLDKTINLNPELIGIINNIKNEYYWLVITEAWCGDAAQSIPIFNKITQYNPNIELRLILRDEEPELINNYLTNGTKSIPILICLDKFNLKEIFKWGPRPKELINFVNEFKKSPDFDKNELIKNIQIWYNKDNTQEIQKELTELLKLLD